MALSVQQLVDDYCWFLLSFTYPGYYINPVFTSVLGTKQQYDELSASTPLAFAPNMFEVLKSTTPPSIEFLTSLPTPPGKWWGVYVVVLVKHDCRPKVYIGSGTDSLQGVSGRTSRYKRPGASALPFHVQRAYAKSFQLRHVGLLCRMPIPSVVLTVPARVRIVALEAIFTAMLYAQPETIFESSWTTSMPWDRNDVEWDPLCSHSPLFDGVQGDLNLTPEQLEANSVARKQRMATHSKTAVERERARDLEGFLQRHRTSSRRAKEKNPARVLERAQQTRTRLKASRKYFCAICNHSDPTPSLLKLHLATKGHASKAAIANGASPSRLSEGALQSREWASQARANKKFYCAVCDLPCASPHQLKGHLASKKHIAKAKLAA